MSNGLKVAAVAVAVGVVTYFGLELLLPRHKAEVTMEGLVPADGVFGQQLKSADEIAAAATPGAATADAAATTPTGPAVNTDDAAAVSGASTATSEASTEAAAPAATEAPAEAAAAPEPAPAAAPPPPAPKVAEAPSEKPAAPSKPARSESKPTQVARAESAPAAKPAKSAGKSNAPASPWWHAEGDGFQISYVGSAAYRKAIVVMSNAPFADAASANKSLHVSDSSGQRVTGTWELNANNKTMLVFPVAKDGNYRVAVDAGLSDAQHRTLGKALKGSVLVQ